MVYINNFENVTEKDAEYVGLKGVNIGYIHKSYNTPKGFIVSTGAFSAFVERTGLTPKIASELSNIPKQKKNLQSIGNDIQKLIVETPMPDFISREIADAYINLRKDYNLKEDLPVAIRSSYTKEITHNDANQLTFLNVSGKDNIIMAVKVAWASLFTFKNMKAREELKLGHNVKNAVIIQAMVYPDKSVLAYTYDLKGNDDSKICIKAMFGIGEGFMYPDTPYDVYTINKSDFKITEKIIAAQPYSYNVNLKNKRIAKFMLGTKEKTQKLNDEEIVEIAKFVDKMSRTVVLDHAQKSQPISDIGKSFSKHQRIELGILGEKVFVFQTKDIEYDPTKKIETVAPIQETETVKEVEKIPEKPKEEIIQPSESIEVLKLELVEQIKNEISSQNNDDSLPEKTLLEIAEDEISDEEKSYDKDFEDAYIELKDIKSNFEKQKPSKEDKVEEETEKIEEPEVPDDSIFSNMK